MQIGTFEKGIFEELEPLELKGSSLAVAVSGGIDSMVALTALDRLKTLLDVRLAVVHIHHGLSAGNEASIQFRNRAYRFVHDQCLAKRLKFFSNIANLDGVGVFVNSSSEEELRRFRYQQMNALLQVHGFHSLVLAHHRDDLLTTRVLRLIRGTGLEGISAMELSRGLLLRPLLRKNRSEIEEYARREEVSFLKDPSNLDQRYLRNWMVEEWLPQLDKKRPGAVSALGRSLELIVSGLSLDRVEGDCAPGVQSLSRSEFLGLSLGEQRQTIARYLKRIGARNYTSGHVSEIIKRLRSNQKAFTFVVARCIWEISVESICATPKISPKI